VSSQTSIKTNDSEQQGCLCQLPEYDGTSSQLLNTTLF